MPKFKVMYKVKQYDSEAGGLISPLANSAVDYRIVDVQTIIRAKTSRHARKKIRNAFGYSITGIRIEEVPSWMTLLLRMIHR